MNTPLPHIRLLATCLLIFVAAGCRDRVSSLAPPANEQDRTKAKDSNAAQPDEATLSAEITSGRWSEVGDEILVDDEVEAIIKPYREDLLAVMEEQIGVADAALVRRRPESPLGNFVADAILNHARMAIDPDADFALMNRGGIRLPELPAGEITVANIYQLVPFDNRVVVLTLTGSQVETLLQSLAVKQGEPLSGIVYQLERDRTNDEKDNWIASNIRIAGAALVPDETYKLATLDYLAGIGGELAVLQKASKRQDGQLFLRDVMIHDIRQRKTISPVIDGRVSYVNESNE